MWLIYTSKHVPQDWINRAFSGEKIVRSVPLVYAGLSDNDEKICHDVSKIIAVGSGRVIDYAKLVASEHNKPLMAVPTSITTDCLFTDVTAVRRGRGVEYVKSKVPDELMLVPSMLMENVDRCNYAWMDLFSSFTATIGIDDLITDRQKSMNETLKQFVENKAILIGTLGDMFYLMHCLKWEVDLCNIAGTALGVEEGLEHYMSYILEGELGMRYMHGEYLLATISFLCDEYDIVDPKIWPMLYPCMPMRWEHVRLNSLDIKPLLEDIQHKALEWLREDVKAVMK